MDEIGSPREVEAAKSIANRGVVLVSYCAMGWQAPPLSRDAIEVRLIAGLPPLGIACSTLSWPPCLPCYCCPCPPHLQVGTAHGKSLQALMRNSDLNGLIGGIHQVTLGDEEARRSNHG